MHEESREEPQIPQPEQPAEQKPTLSAEEVADALKKPLKKSPDFNTTQRFNMVRIDPLTGKIIRPKTDAESADNG